MRALVLPEKNKALELQEKPDLVPEMGEAVVRIHAAALNHRDVWIQKGQYAGLKYPITPGSDGAGVVAAVGGSEGKEWVGKKVIINPSMGWGADPSHQDQRTFNILGLPHDGTLAEFVKVPVEYLVDMPGHLTYEEAAAIPLAGATAYRSLFTRAGLAAKVRTGSAGTQKVLITGIGGGVALFALQYAVAAGAMVFVTSGNDEKIGKAMALGAVGGANYRNAGWVEHLRDLAGSFDITIDGASGNSMNELLNLATPGGNLVFYGATTGNPATLEARRIFWKQLNVLGSTMASPDDFKDMIAFINSTKLRPIVDKVFSFGEGEAALRRMDNAEQFGKIVIRID